MSPRTKAILAILLAQLLWSTAGLSKIIVRELDPYVAGFLRFFVASVVILPFFLKEKFKSKHMVRDMLPFSLAGAINVVFFYVGLETSTANAASLIYAGVPLVTALIAHYAIAERLIARRLIGIITGGIGVLFIALLPLIERGESASGNFPGNIFFILATLTWSCYLVGSRRASTKHNYSPLTISSMFIFVTCIIFFIISLFTFTSSYIETLRQPSMVLLILHLGTLVTVATFTLHQWAIKYPSATTASLSTYIGPIFAVTANSILLGEKITPGFVTGAAIVFAGILITSGKGLVEEMRSWILK